MQHHCIVLEAHQDGTQIFPASTIHTIDGAVYTQYVYIEQKIFTKDGPISSRCCRSAGYFLSAKGNLGIAKGSDGKVTESLSTSGRGLVVDRNKSVFQSPYLEYQKKERRLASLKTNNGW